MWTKDVLVAGSRPHEAGKGEHARRESGNGGRQKRIKRAPKIPISVEHEAGAEAGTSAEAWTFLLRGSVGAQLGRTDTRPDLERALAFWEDRLSLIHI